MNDAKQKPAVENPPAFPQTHPNIDPRTAGWIGGGLTMRDWFAGQALVGFQVFVRGGWSGEVPHDMARQVAANCYELADAMLRERAKP